MSELEVEMEKVVNHLKQLQSIFNIMRSTLKEIISKVEPDWNVSTPTLQGVGEEQYGPFMTA